MTTMNSIGTQIPIEVAKGGLGTETLTAHGVLIGNGTDPANVTAAGTATQIFQSGGSESDPVWSTFTMPGTVAQGDLLCATAANTITAITKDANATRYISNTGADNNAAWAQIDLSNGVTGTLPTANGGTGITTNPTDGALLIGKTADNSWAVATITAGVGIGITNGENSITITATGSGLTWSVVTEATQAAVGNGYICNSDVARVVVTLPDTAAVGSIVELVGMGSEGWQLAQNAGETVYIGSVATTEGVGGSLASTDAGDCIELVCIEENVKWRVKSIVGNITVV